MKKSFILTAAIILSMAWSMNLCANDTIRMVWQGNGYKSIEADVTSGTFYIDWGDGSAIQAITPLGDDPPASVSHIYSNANTYTVTVSTANSYCFLTVFGCDNGQVTSLDVSKSPRLTELSSFNNHQLTFLNISNNPRLKFLECSNNQLGTLDVSNNTQLQYLVCGNNLLTSLDVSNNIQLRALSCDGNQLTSLDVSNNPQLIDLSCASNPLSTLDIINNQLLEGLHCSNNPLGTLDVSNNMQLRALSCDGNQLTSLDVSNNWRLEWLYCNNNQLSSLDVSNNPQLWSLKCFDNQFQLSDLYAAYQQTNNMYYTYLGTQRLPIQVALTDIPLFSSQTEFGGVSTKFYVEKGGVQADSAVDYIVNNGLVFLNVGNYTVTMTNVAIQSHPDYPAKVIVDITVDFNNGIVETDNYPSLRIYPNPASEYLYVKLAEPQTADYNIYNIMGQIVKKGTLQGDDVINISSLKKGTYFMKIAETTMKLVVND